MRALSKELIDELTLFLDCQSEHLERMLGFLDTLREALIRRNPTVLQEMQEHLLQESKVRQSLDQSLENLKEKIGRQLGCSAQEVCLSLICRAAGTAAEQAIVARQRHLAEQVIRLRQQHQGTELLVRECARLNQRYLEALTGQREKGTTYDSRGRSARSAQAGLLSVAL